MKRVCMKTAMLVVLWCCTMGAWAYDFEADGIYYGITSTADKTVEVVVGDAKYSGDVTIPATVAYNGMTYRVTSIGEHAFYDCSNLASIVIPEGVTSIRDYAFYDCSSLTSIVIPKGLTSIGNSAFHDCSSLASITLPESLTSIGEHAFSFCSSLTSIVIPDGVTSIGENAFSDCGSLASITFSESLTSIGKNAFFNCRALASIVIPDGVTTIEYYTFGSCSGLTSITIPEGVTSIGDGAFDSCSSLASITIPEGVTSIGYYAFRDCSSLASITLPESLTSIGWRAFYGCISLQAIHSRAITPPTCGTYCFYSVDKTSCTLYVPKGMLEAYKAADEWKDFVDIVEEEYTGIEEVGADSAGQAVITACGDGIVVENLPAGTTVTVYILSGTVVYEGVASGSRTELTLPAGHLYLVKCGPTVTKVIF